MCVEVDIYASWWGDGYCRSPALLSICWESPSHSGDDGMSGAGLAAPFGWSQCGRTWSSPRPPPPRYCPALSTPSAGSYLTAVSRRPTPNYGYSTAIPTRSFSTIRLVSHTTTYYSIRNRTHPQTKLSSHRIEPCPVFLFSVQNLQLPLSLRPQKCLCISSIFRFSHYIILVHPIKTTPPCQSATQHPAALPIRSSLVAPSRFSRPNIQITFSRFLLSTLVLV